MASYIVKLIKFDCGDESGVDRLGSDEVLWVFSARDSNGAVNTTHSRKFGNVDSGDSFKFKSGEESIVWPKKNDTKGDKGPIELSIQLWEIDKGDPDDIAKKTQKAFDLGALAPGVGEWVKRVPSVVRDKLNDLIADDLMGSKSLLYSEARLRKLAPEVGDRTVEKHHFGGRGGDLPFEVAGGPDYHLHYAIARVA
jgi:hypothetical protein